MRTCEQKRTKRHLAIAKKLDLIKQNQVESWIMRIRFVLHQLKKTKATNLWLTSFTNMSYGQMSLHKKDS